MSDAQSSQWVALLRGVNVGGANRLPMAELRQALTGAGLEDVRSYIQSGNLILRCDGDPEGRVTQVCAELGAHVQVWTAPDVHFRAILHGCPFPDGKGNQVHAFLPFDPLTIDEAAKARWIIPSETLMVVDGIAWLHAPDGIGRSRLAANMHKVVTGTETTARNLNTMRRLVEMLDSG